MMSLQEEDGIPSKVCPRVGDENSDEDLNSEESTIFLATSSIFRTFLKSTLHTISAWSWNAAGSCVIPDDDNKNTAIVHGPRFASLPDGATAHGEEWEYTLSNSLNISDRGNEICNVNDKSCVRHIKQDTDWDCGIASLLMAFQWIGISCDVKVLRDVMVSMAATQSIWTVDLVYILDKFLNPTSFGDTDIDTIHTSVSYSYLFSSRSLAVNPVLCHYPYYASSFANDSIRVNFRFSTIKNAIQQDFLDVMEVIKIVERNDCLAIALVDNSVLNRCNAESTAANRKMQFIHREVVNEGTYTGHYIVLAGVCNDPTNVKRAAVSFQDTSKIGHDNSTTIRNQRDCFFIVHNPGSDKHVQYLPIAHFQRAWRAKGTDEDIIFIRKHS